VSPGFFLAAKEGKRPEIIELHDCFAAAPLRENGNGTYRPESATLLPRASLRRPHPHTHSPKPDDDAH
jgi:hypothetical protein